MFVEMQNEWAVEAERRRQWAVYQSLIGIGIAISALLVLVLQRSSKQ